MSTTAEEGLPMTSIRFRLRPDPDPEFLQPEVELSGDDDVHKLSKIALPRDLLPAGHRHRAERPVLARRLRAVTHPRFYAAQAGDPALAGDVDKAIAHFLHTGLRDGARISGLFNPDVYRERLWQRGLTLPAVVHPFLHFLAVGWEERVVPTVLFDEEFYLGRRPELAGGREWGFAHYLRAGCYGPGRSPTPFGANYGSGEAAPDAKVRQDPPLVAGLLHRASDYDLTRTSWLEEGVAAGAAKLATLASERMRVLVEKAAAIEPLITAAPRERSVSWPPHTHRMVMTTARAEDVRRGIGLVRADTVVVAPGGASVGAGLRAAVSALRTLEPAAQVLIVTTDDPVRPDLGDNAFVVDLSVPWTGFTEHRRLLGLLDVVRGVRPRRVVVAGSELGWRLLSTYGPTLRHEMSLAAAVGEPAPGEDVALDDFQGSFDRLDWVVTDTDALRDDLTARYLLPEKSRARLLSAADCATGALAAVARAGGERNA
jgi:hypothetical protein